MAYDKFHKTSIALVAYRLVRDGYNVVSLGVSREEDLRQNGVPVEHARSLKEFARGFAAATKL